MKAITLFLFIIITCSPTRNKETINNQNHLVTKIDSINNYYVIYTKQNNQNYKFVSEKSSTGCRDKIVVGKKYDFNMKSIFEFKIKDKDTVKEITNHVNIDCIILGETKICKEYENEIFDVYTSKNLEGLCYTHR